MFLVAAIGRMNVSSWVIKTSNTVTYNKPYALHYKKKLCLTYLCLSTGESATQRSHCILQHFSFSIKKVFFQFEKGPE